MWTEFRHLRHHGHPVGGVLAEPLLQLGDPRVEHDHLFVRLAPVGQQLGVHEGLEHLRLQEGGQEGQKRVGLVGQEGGLVEVDHRVAQTSRVVVVRVRRQLVDHHELFVVGEQGGEVVQEEFTDDIVEVQTLNSKVCTN